MGKPSDLDQKLESRGAGMRTLWQFVKFSIVSMLASVVQFVTLTVVSRLPFVVALGDTAFHWFVFHYPVESTGLGGLGYFIAFNTANVAAQIVAFFVNRDKTFHANNSVAVTLTIYLVFTVALICFSAWLSPVIHGFLLEKHLPEFWALNLATVCCSMIQFFLYFPLDKLLMRKKKEK